MKDGTSMRDYCLREGISYNVAYKRCDEDGMQPEEAVESAKQLRPKNRKHFINGVSLRQVCDQKMVPYQSVIDIIHKKGLSALDAFNYVYNRNYGGSK